MRVHLFIHSYFDSNKHITEKNFATLEILPELELRESESFIKNI